MLAEVTFCGRAVLDVCVFTWLPGAVGADLEAQPEMRSPGYWGGRSEELGQWVSSKCQGLRRNK